MRMAEIHEAYKLMCTIHKGEGWLLTEQSLRDRGHVGSSTGGLDNVNWDAWRGRFSLENVTMVGHSFGGATTASILRHASQVFPYISQGIIYDIWGLLNTSLVSDEADRHLGHL